MSCSRRQNLVLQVNFRVENQIFREKKGLVDTILGGWELAGITLAETGLP